MLSLCDLPEDGRFRDSASVHYEIRWFNAHGLTRKAGEAFDVVRVQFHGLDSFGPEYDHVAPLRSRKAVDEFVGEDVIAEDLLPLCILSIAHDRGLHCAGGYLERLDEERANRKRWQDRDGKADGQDQDPSPET